MQRKKEREGRRPRLGMMMKGKQNGPGNELPSECRVGGDVRKGREILELNDIGVSVALYVRD